MPLRAPLLGVMLISLVASCGSRAPTPDVAPACVTRGAEYLFHVVESTGTCDYYPDKKVWVFEDGTVHYDTGFIFWPMLVGRDGVSCEAPRETGCIVRDSKCVTHEGDVTCNASTNLTFTRDGAAASGRVSIECSNLYGSCHGTYAVTAVRQ